MRAFEQRKTNLPDNTAFFGPKIQKKLKTGKAGDKYEVEADHVADKVVHNNSSYAGLLQSKEEIQQKPISETISSVQAKDIKEEEPVQKKSDKKEEEKPIQAKCEACEKEDQVQKKDKEEEKPVQAKCEACEKEDKIQKKEQNSKTEVNSELEEKLDNSKGSGTGLDKKTKREMESGFGSDFGNVKIHTDASAVQMSQELGAQAFTNGNDVYFNDGKYNPDSKEGKHLLAHELTHTVQQTGMVQKSTIEDHPENLQNPADPHFKGNPPLEKANDNQMLITKGQKGGYVSEIQTGLLKWRDDSLPNFGADGDFGSETRNAVLDFQIENGLKGKDGIVGPETMGTLDNILVRGKGNKKKTKACIDPEARNLPQMINPINIHDSVMSSGSEFLSKGSFKITSNADWAQNHPVQHYRITVIEFISGSMKTNKFPKKFKIGQNVSHTFVFPKDKCVSFKVLVEVINPTANSPKLVGNFIVSQ